MSRLVRFSLLTLLTALLLMADGLTLNSSDIHEWLSLKQVYDGYGCHGENLSPALSWQGEPKDTKSFAVTVFDPDAPTGRGWWHWLLFNIPAYVHRLPRGAGSADGRRLPWGAVQSLNDFGTVGYGGACPPPGDRPHRYVFTVYALDTAKLPLAPETPPATVAEAIEKHTLAKASLISRYGR